MDDNAIGKLFARLDEINMLEKDDPAFDKMMQTWQKARRKLLYPGMTEAQIKECRHLTYRLKVAEKLGIVTIDLRGHLVGKLSKISDKIPTNLKNSKAVGRIVRALQT